MKKAKTILLISALLLTFIVTKQLNVMQDTEEIWKDVVGYEGRYQVSNIGRVKNILLERIRKQHLHQGYWRVTLINNRLRGFLAHRLVAIAFIPNLEGKETVNHKDGNKLNNSVSNLEWCTQTENVRHAIKNNLKPPTMVGEDSYSAKITEKQAIIIKFGDADSLYLAKKFSISRSLVYAIRKGRAWKHLTPET